LSTPFFHRRLAAPERKKLLDGVLARIRAQAAQSPAIIVFDLDGTLMDNRPRVVAILHELSEFWRPIHPEAAARCALAQPDDIQLRDHREPDAASG
jgi:hypothetical protein